MILLLALIVGSALISGVCIYRLSRPLSPAEFEQMQRDMEAGR